MGGGNSATDLSAAAQRLASSGRMESFLRSLSNNNVGGSASATNLNSSTNLSNLMKSMQQQHQQQQDFFRQSGGVSTASLANLLRPESSTGLSALRMQEGLNQRNTSVDDFLSLMAAGDIPHQDPSMLNVPLMDQQQGGSHVNQQQRQQLQNAALANALNGMGGGQNANSQANMQAMALMMAQAMGNPQNASGTKRSLDEAGGGELPSAKR